MRSMNAPDPRARKGWLLAAALEAGLVTSCCFWGTECRVGIAARQKDRRNPFDERHDDCVIPPSTSRVRPPTVTLGKSLSLETP